VTKERQDFWRWVVEMLLTVLLVVAITGLAVAVWGHTLPLVGR
jgi:hypothetical protein